MDEIVRDAVEVPSDGNGVNQAQREHEPERCAREQPKQKQNVGKMQNSTCRWKGVSAGIREDLRLGLGSGNGCVCGFMRCGKGRPKLEYSRFATWGWRYYDSSAALLNLGRILSYRVGSKYGSIRRKMGLIARFKCLTYRSRGASRKRMRSFGS